MIKTDVAIIGAGPVGLFGVFEAGMLGLKSCVIDCLNAPGGQCSALYPEKPIYDIPAFSKITGQKLIEQLQEQIQPFNPTFVLNSKVIDISSQNEDSEYKFHVKTNSGENIYAKAVIVAVGGGAFDHKKPDLKDIERFENISVFYNVKDKSLFKDKKVVIAGGGDSAVDWALNLYEIAKKIYVVHRREKFRCAPESIRKLREISETNDKVEFIIPYQLFNIEGNLNNGTISHVIVQDFDDNIKSIEAEFLLSFFGLSMDMSDINNWHVNIQHNNNGIFVDYATMMTSENGVFAAGDITQYSGKLKLILTGFSEITLACHSAYKFINPDKPMHFEHSTTKGIINHNF